MSENQERINGFLEGLKTLCEKYNIDLQGDYDGFIYLSDRSSMDMISETVDFGDFSAKEYIEPEPKPRDPNAKPISLSEAESVIRDSYAENIKKSLEQEDENPFLKLMRRNGN